MSLVALGALSALLAVSCGGDSPSTSAAPTTSTSTAPATAPSTTVAAVPTTTEPVPDPVSPSSTTTTTPESVDVSFAESIMPIVSSCAVCHQPGGPGSPHWALATAADVTADPGYLADLVGSRSMPPWPAGPDSVDFDGDRSLSEQDVADFLAWYEAGGDLDVDPTTPIEAPESAPALAEVDVAMTAGEPYTGSPGVVDDYRCFVHDPGVTDAAWVTGFQFVADRTDVVHHAIGYLLPASARPLATAADDADPGPGWSCYGSSGLDADDQIFLGWAPGQDPSVLPEGSGIPLDAGDFFVTQIHYHYEAGAPPDSSALLVDLAGSDAALDDVHVRQYVAPAELPCTTEQSGPLCDRDAALADAIERFGNAGVQADRINATCGAAPSDFVSFTDGVAQSSCDLPVYGFGQIVSVLGHLHELGASFKMTLNPDTDDELVLLDIPRWSFDWQLNYGPVDDIALVPGDMLRIECSWDRSLGDNGDDDRYILWADGTDDEMCFSTVATRSLG